MLLGVLGEHFWSHFCHDDPAFNSPLKLRISVKYILAVASTVQNNGSFEHELRELIRDVKLIGEIDLRLTGQNYLNARIEINRVIKKHGRGYLEHVIAEGAIASYVIMLAALAFSAYDDGTFWPNVRIQSDGDPMDASKLPFYKSENENRRFGSMFQQCLEILHKDTFSEEIIAENGLSLLGPILLHAGLPASTVSDVWILLLREFSEGTSNAADLVINLRQDRVKTQYLDKPAQRFINYGGNFVVDLFQRMLNVVEDKPVFAHEEVEIIALEFGIPPLYLEKLISIESKIGPKKSVSLPVPTLIFDEFSLNGPYIELPILRKEIASGKWRILGGVSSTRNPTFVIDASYLYSRQVHIRPDRFWNVNIETEDERVRKFSFQSTANGKALLFNAESGEFIHPRTVISCAEVILLGSKEIGFTGSIGTHDEQLEQIQLPQIGGVWSEWNGYRIRIGEIEKLSLFKLSDTGREIVGEFIVGKFAQRPELIGDLVEGFKDLDGGVVFSKIPLLKFPAGTPLEKLSMRIRFSDGRISTGLNLGEMSNEDGYVDFSTHVNDGLVSLTLFVQGTQLGSDFNARLVVVPKLDFEIEDRIFHPTELVEGIIRYENSEHKLTFLEGEDFKQIELSDEMATIQLGLRISRLTHCVRVENEELIFGCKIQTVTKEQFIARTVSQVVARCYKEAFFQLHVEDLKGKIVASSERMQTLGLDKRVAFDLLRFIDDVNNTPSQLLTIFFYLGTQKVELLKVVTRYSVQFQNIFVSEYGGVAGDSKVSFTFTESHKLNERDFVLRKIQNPWQEDISVRLSDDLKSEVTLTVSKLIPGKYAVGMRSGDAEPVFSGSLQVGSKEDYQKYIASLAATTPDAVAELICNGVPSRLSHLDVGFAPKLTTMLASMLDNIAVSRILQDFLIIDLSIARLLDERLSGRPFIDWWFTSLSKNPRQNYLTVDQLLVSAYRTLAANPLDPEFARLNRDDIWKLSPLFGAAIDVFDERDSESRRVWHENVGEIGAADKFIGIVPPGRHHANYSFAQIDENLESALIRTRDGSFARFPILTRKGYLWSFYSYLKRVYEGDDMNPDNKSATQARIWSKSDGVKDVVEFVHKLDESTDKYFHQLKPVSGLDSKFNVVEQVCGLAFISMSYHPEIVKARIDQQAAVLLTKIYEHAPELVEFFLLLALRKRRFRS